MYTLHGSRHDNHCPLMSCMCSTVRHIAHTSSSRRETHTTYIGIPNEHPHTCLISSMGSPPFRTPIHQSRATTWTPTPPAQRGLHHRHRHSKTRGAKFTTGSRSRTSWLRLSQHADTWQVQNPKAQNTLQLAHTRSISLHDFPVRLHWGLVFVDDQIHAIKCKGLGTRAKEGLLACQIASKLLVDVWRRLQM